MHKDNHKIQLKSCLGKSVVFDSNTTDFSKSVVFGFNTTDFERMIWVESGVM